MRNLKLTLAYDGTDFCGWQVQPGQRTVQATVEQTLHTITGEEIRVVASGRTDSGVHAFGQVISFPTDSKLPVESLLRAMNAELPADVRIQKVEEAPADFHALRSAVCKRYRYTIDNGRVDDLFDRRVAWHIPVPLDVEAMQRAANLLIGRHDFSSFESVGAERASSVRTISALAVSRCQRVERWQGGQPGQGGEGELVNIEIEADGFLYNMVRAIAGTLVEVGRGAKREAWVGEVLQALDRKQAGMTAPAQGLTLMWVRYE